MTASQMVGSIITAQWLADQMGLSVEEVERRIDGTHPNDQAGLLDR